MKNVASPTIVHFLNRIFSTQESLGIQLEIRKDRFAEEKKDNSDETLQVALLADLQQIQDTEAQNMFTNLEAKVIHFIQVIIRFFCILPKLSIFIPSMSGPQFSSFSIDKNG